MEPAHGIAQGAYFTLLVFVDHPNGNEFDNLPSGDESMEQLGLDLKMPGPQRHSRPGPKVHQTETALRIRQLPSGSE